MSEQKDLPVSANNDAGNFRKSLRPKSRGQHFDN